MSAMPTFPAVIECGDSMNTPKKRQVNFYLDVFVDQEMRDAVHERQRDERGFSLAKLLGEEVWPLYRLAMRYHAQTKHTGSVYDFAYDAFQSFLNRPK